MVILMTLIVLMFMTKQTGNDEDVLKRELLELIAFAYRRVKKDKCTTSEMKSILDTLSNHMAIWASPEDLSRFYGQSESNVRNVLARNYVPSEKVRRKATEYDFGFFKKIMPRSWTRKVK